jgi:serine protease AprX
VIVRAPNAAARLSMASTLPRVGGRSMRSLPLIGGIAVDLPNAAIGILAQSPSVGHLSLDRAIVGAVDHTGAAVGAPFVRQELGVDGSGVGVAVIDSGITSWHDDLADAALTTARVDRFVDFVDGRTDAYDDYGHGTHVAGIVAGDGYDSSGGRVGIAPGAHIIALKALDANGAGRISDVIAAIDYAVQHKGELNIRVINLSVAAGVFESYNDDPLTLAAKAAVSAGIVVVAAAGNNGRSAAGTPQYGGITAPGNAPWVLTVGASSHMGTADRSDDTMASFSSRGPGQIDYTAKPDLVAPGVGIESLSVPDSLLYSVDAPYLLSGTIAMPPFPYLSLTGTSMATPVVSGTVALMLQANPSLTPNEVKAILQYTSQPYPGYDALTEGAGFLNAEGAVELAAYLVHPGGTAYPDATIWSGHLVWGNHLASGGRITADANAWDVDVTWGSPQTSVGSPVFWGRLPDGSAWQTACLNLLCDLLGPAAGTSPNVVWGDTCGGFDCAGIAWTAGEVNATSDPEGDTVVWGTSDNTEGDTVVWGTSCTDPSCKPVIWKQ